MSKLYIITGPAGVGKSTISKEIAKKSKKSALIEGDEIYHLVCGGYESAWKKGNHLEVFWKNVINIINNFLEDGYDVIFNYIIKNNTIEMLRRTLKYEDTKFVVLLSNEETIVKRDKERIEENQMGERSLILLKQFKEEQFDNKFILDTTNLTIEDVTNKIIEDDKYKI